MGLDFAAIRQVAKKNIHKLYQPDRQGRGFVCPLCDNGTGKSGDGVNFIKKYTIEGATECDILHCFKCGFSGDIIKLKAAEMNCSYVEAAKMLAEYFGLSYSSSYPRKIFRKITKVVTPSDTFIPRVDYSDFFAKAATAIKNTDYWKRRGFSLETCKHFQLGFEFAWTHPKVNNAPKSPRLIIPTSKFSYLARDTRKNIPDYQEKYSKQKVGSVSLFNLDALASDCTFVVEGEFDAISFYEIGFEAVALGSTSSVNKFIKHIKTHRVLPKFLILALDNDDAGKETTVKLKKMLDSIGVPNAVADNIYGDHKDANEALVANREFFLQSVTREIDKKNSQGKKSCASADTPPAVVSSIDTSEPVNPQDEKARASVDTSSPAVPPVATSEPVNPQDEKAHASVDTLPAVVPPIDTSELVNPQDEKAHESVAASPPAEPTEADLSDIGMVEIKHDEIIPTDSSKKANTGNKALDEAIDLLNSVTEFTNETVLTKKILKAVALCKVYEPAVFAVFRLKCKKGSVEIRTFDSSFKEFLKPIQKQKKIEDKCLEQQYEREMALKLRAEADQRRIDDLKTIEYLQTQPSSEERDEQIISLIRENLERYKNGEPKRCSENFELILKYDPIIGGCIGYDSFSNRFVPRRTLPWDDPKFRISGRAWSNFDDSALANYISRTYDSLDSFKTLMRVVDEFAIKNKFHPVVDYLDSLPAWDGTPRSETFFVDALNVADTYYARCVTLHWLTAAVARVKNPGCKWDYALIVKGSQGVGKSTCFAKLGGKWFNDSIDSINGKDATEQLIGSWIVELGEMQATKKSTNDAIKAFISRRIDKIRLPYFKRSEEYHRQAIFAGTTNEEEFLKDFTGNRRFFILVSLADDAETRERLAKIDQHYIDQLWAEVLFFYNQLFKDGFDATKLIPPQAVFDAAKQLQGDYTEGSEIEGMIRNYLDVLLPENWNCKTMVDRRAFIQNAKPADNTSPAKSIEEAYDDLHHNGDVKRTVVSAIEIAYELFKVDDPGRSRTLLRQINEILARLEGWTRITWKRCGVYGQQRIAFERRIRENENAA